LATLERNLDSKVVVIRNHVEELVAHGPQVSEVLNTYVLRPYRDY
jgi:endoribonuclease Dicer